MLYVYLSNQADIIFCVLEVMVLDNKSLTVSLSLEYLGLWIWIKICKCEHGDDVQI